MAKFFSQSSKIHPMQPVQPTGVPSWACESCLDPLEKKLALYFVQPRERDLDLVEPMSLKLYPVLVFHHSSK